MSVVTVAAHSHRYVSAWRRTSMVVVVCLLAALFPLPAAGQEVPELQINSKAYIVLDADTGEIFAQRNAHERRAPASLTKVFTAIETIESAPPDITITTSEADLVSDQASQVGFSPGETFTVEELLYGMMLPSGNDAARALARSLGAEPGDTDEEALAHFLDRINQRVRNMGLTDTQLLNPDGWGIPGHYSSAYDLAVFTMYALRYPRFVRAFGTQTYETADGRYVFENNNRLLRIYDGILGGKTGYDLDAGWCLIGVAQRDGSTMIAVTMDGIWPDDWYDDNRVLLDYAFEQKTLRQRSGQGIVGEVASYRDPDAAVILAMGSAGGTIGQPAPAPLIEAAPEPRLEPVPNLGSAQQGASGAGLLVAASVAVALIALQGLSTWRLVQPRAVMTSQESSRLSAQPGDLLHEPPTASAD